MTRSCPCIRRRDSRSAWFAAMLATVAGCQGQAQRSAPPDHAQAPKPHVSPAAAEVSYDWHGLLIAPFGSALKDIPVPLHEVLLFADPAHGGGAADDVAAGASAGAPECYAPDAHAPDFAGRTPEEYLLCFKQDRLSRVQAAVRLPAAEAQEVAAAACADWLLHAAAPTDGAAGSPAAGPPAGTPGASPCEGRDGAVHFSGRLEEEESILSITLDNAAIP